MAQAHRKKSPEHSMSVNLSRGIRESTLYLLSAIAAYLVLSLATYHTADPGWSYSGGGDSIQNAGGSAGAWLADVFLSLFGYFAFLFPVMIAYSGWIVFSQRNRNEGVDMLQLGIRWSGCLLTLASGSGLASMHLRNPLLSMPSHAGGILGDVIAEPLAGMFSVLGTTVLLLAVFLAGVTLFTGVSWFQIMDTLGGWSLRGFDCLRASVTRFGDYITGMRARRQRTESVRVEHHKAKLRPPSRIEPVIRKIEVSERVERERQVPLFETSGDNELPPLALLEESGPAVGGFSEEALQAMSRLVEIKLRDFGIEVEVVAVHPGPVITRFELQPAPGVKVSQISNLAKDLARSLSTLSVRVVEIIPGKSVIGLEIPNERREMVTLGDILKSPQYDDMKSPLAMALGKDVSGLPVVVDLERMPHLLVAGTTGSGKSVAINAMVLSILFKALPSDVRLIMIDPKMLELSVYEGIPHLLTPVVTDMNEAANALRWCVIEMDDRYRRMSALGVRNITGYNRKVREAIDNGTPIPDPLFKLDPLAESQEVPTLTPLPYVVVFIDELADMMMIVGKKVESLIARLAQKARAAGIHLILATQRPSVDVLTGLIKANIPTRIAFQVSSKIDSRTILDQMGAESLLGQGDMLYLPGGTSIPTRVHGAFVDDPEVHRVVANLKKQGPAEYVDLILQDPGELSADTAGGGSAEDSDPLYDQAVRIVTETRRASISGVQRRLKVGYNRAARMIESMEAAGIVGTLQSNGSREVLAPPPPED